MKIRSIRRITNDSNHNAFTGAQWFQGALYVAFRQGDKHGDDPQGKIVVMRSRDEGVSFDIVAVLRGELDTRDAHLHAEGDKRLFVNGFESDGSLFVAGTAWTDNGFNWSPWTRLQGTEDYIMWRPEYSRHLNRHVCAGYRENKDWSRVSWFESEDGVQWRNVRALHEGEDQPNECSLDFKPDGTAALLMRREHRSRKPLLLRSTPPYEQWTKTELDIPLAGPSLWYVGDELWISGRWFFSDIAAHQGVFVMEGDTPVPKIVLPSGPGVDFSYMGVARHPLNERRFFLSYYSNHDAPANPAVPQWLHPDIYLVDATFSAEFIQNWQVSPLQNDAAFRASGPPAPADDWTALQSTPAGGVDPGFVSAASVVKSRPGIIYFATELEVGPCDAGVLHLGYDGPVCVWLNGDEVFRGNGTNPAQADQTSLPVEFQHGTNRLTIGLDTNNGRAEGIFARYETR